MEPPSLVAVPEPEPEEIPPDASLAPEPDVIESSSLPDYVIDEPDEVPPVVIPDAGAGARSVGPAPRVRRRAERRARVASCAGRIALGARGGRGSRAAPRLRHRSHQPAGAAPRPAPAGAAETRLRSSPRTGQVRSGSFRGRGAVLPARDGIPDPTRRSRRRRRRARVVAHRVAGRLPSPTRRSARPSRPSRETRAARSAGWKVSRIA